jgi:O-antigen/teichoic acid export membrane protein
MNNISTSGNEMASGASFKSRVYRAGGWTVGGYVASLALRLGSTVIFTRLFAPEVYGILAVAIAVQVAVAMLSDIGLHQAVIRSPNGHNLLFLNTAWTLQLARSCWVWLLCIFGAGIVQAAVTLGWVPPGSVYAAPILPSVIVASSFGSVILGLRSMKAVTANRNLDLKLLTSIDLVGQIINLLVILLMGWITRSIWSFIVGGLASSASATLLSHLWFRGPMDRLAWNRDALRELMHFGKWVFLTSIIGAFAANGDRLLLGGWLNPAMLGYYSIAANVAGVAEGAAGRLFASVMLPTFSQIVRTRPDQLSTLYTRVRWVVDAVMVGSAGFLWATSEWMVGLLYDARYASAGPMLQWLSCGLLFARYALPQSAWLALGYPGYMTALNLAKTISLFVLVPLLYHSFGVQGAIFGIAFHAMPAWLCVFWLNRAHGLNNVYLDLAVIGAWPLGWLAGSGIIVAVHSLTAIMHDAAHFSGL